MTNKLHRRSSIGLSIAIIFFFAGFFFGLFGYKLISTVLMWICVGVFLWTYFITAKFVINVNRKAWIRYKNKKDIFTESILDDDEEDPPVK